MFKMADGAVSVSAKLSKTDFSKADLINKKTCCGSTAKSGIACVVCNSFYHPSCVASKRIKQCCGVQLGAAMSGEEGQTGTGIGILIALVNEMKSALGAAFSTIESLNTKVDSLTAEVRDLRKAKNRNNNITEVNDNVNYPSTLSPSAAKKNPQKKTKATYHTGTSRLAETARKDREDECAPSALSTPVVSVADNDRDGFVMPRRKFNRGPRITTGTAPADNKLKRHSGKHWICVKKLDASVTADDICDYIARKTKMMASQLVVNDLPSRGKSKAFQVGFEADYDVQLSSADFWPRGIEVKRFNFNFNNKGFTKISNRQSSG